MKKQPLYLLTLHLQALVFAALLLSSCTSIATSPPGLFEAEDLSNQQSLQFLEDLSDPKTINFIEANQQYSKRETAGLRRLQSRLYFEMQKKLNQLPAAEKLVFDKDSFFLRKQAGESLPAVYRKNIQTEQTSDVFNPNTELRPLKVSAFHSFRLSQDLSSLALTLTLDGEKFNRLFVKNLSTNRIQVLSATDISGFEWDLTGTALYYSTRINQRPAMLFKISTMKPDSPQLIFLEKDPAAFLRLEKSKSGRLLLLNSSTAEMTVVYQIDLRSSARLSRLLPGQKGVHYRVQEREQDLLVLGNQSSPQYQIWSLPREFPLGRQPELLYQAAGSGIIEDFEAGKNYLAVFENHYGTSKLILLRADAKIVSELACEHPSIRFSKGLNPNYQATTFNYRVAALNRPTAELQLDLTGSKPTSVCPVAADTEQNTEYVVEKIEFTSPANVKIPVFLNYHRKTEKNSKNLLALEVYGAYGDNLPLKYSAERNVLLDHGAIYAVAEVRGGGFYGQSWHNQGRKLNKKNSVIDYLAVVQGLINGGYTSSRGLFAVGKSAGGLIIGAALNRQPELFAGAVLDAPFLDPISTMQRPSLPFTIREYQEWGNPQREAELSYLRSYAPLENIKQQNYPPILITARLSDLHVRISESLKWLARLRALKTDKNLQLLLVNAEGDHLGAADQSDELMNRAMSYSWILNRAE